MLFVVPSILRLPAQLSRPFEPDEPDCSPVSFDREIHAGIDDQLTVDRQHVRRLIGGTIPIVTSAVAVMTAPVAITTRSPGTGAMSPTHDPGVDQLPVVTLLVMVCHSTAPGSRTNETAEPPECLATLSGPASKSTLPTDVDEVDAERLGRGRARLDAVNRVHQPGVAGDRERHHGPGGVVDVGMIRPVVPSPLGDLGTEGCRSYRW